MDLSCRTSRREARPPQRAKRLIAPERFLLRQNGFPPITRMNTNRPTQSAAWAKATFYQSAERCWLDHWVAAGCARSIRLPVQKPSCCAHPTKRLCREEWNAGPSVEPAASLPPSVRRSPACRTASRPEFGACSCCQTTGAPCTANRSALRCARACNRRRPCAVQGRKRRSLISQRWKRRRDRCARRRPAATANSGSCQPRPPGPPKSRAGRGQSAARPDTHSRVRPGLPPAPGVRAVRPPTKSHPG